MQPLINWVKGRASGIGARVHNRVTTYLIKIYGQECMAHPNKDLGLENCEPTWPSMYLDTRV